MLLSAAANMMANKGDDVEVIVELNNRAMAARQTGLSCGAVRKSWTRSR
jgi:hypothetical protein